MDREVLTIEQILEGHFWEDQTHRLHLRIEDLDQE